LKLEELIKRIARPSYLKGCLSSNSIETSPENIDAEMQSFGTRRHEKPVPGWSRLLCPVLHLGLELGPD
jgi:hypothetical protein